MKVWITISLMFLIENSEVKIIPATTMQDAADKVVNAALN